MSNRDAFVNSLLTDLEAILPGNLCTEVYRQLFAEMDDAAFERFVKRCEEGYIVPLIVPNLKGPQISVERNLKVAEAWGHAFFERLWLTDPATGIVHLTPKRYLVIEWPMRRQQQTLDKKMSVPKDLSNIDDLTGQVTGDSKGSSVTLPELQLLFSEGLPNTIAELIKVRGGDADAYAAYERALINRGEVELGPIMNAGTRPKATTTLSAFLTSAHLRNNL